MLSLLVVFESKPQCVFYKKSPQGNDQGGVDLHSGRESRISRLQLTVAVLCSGMVSDKRVFPTKDNTWVSLARKPLVADNKELEKIFRPHKQICLLNLPVAEKKTIRKSKTGNTGTLLLQFYLHMA